MKVSVLNLTLNTGIVILLYKASGVLTVFFFHRRVLSTYSIQQEIAFHWLSYFINQRTKGRFLNKMSTYKQSGIHKPLLITLFIHILYVAVHQGMLNMKTSKQKQQQAVYYRFKLWQISPTRHLLEKLSELLLFSCLR